MPGKDCAKQLASKALMKKSAEKNRSCKGKALIETAPETEDALQQVIDTHMQIHCVSVQVNEVNDIDRLMLCLKVEETPGMPVPETICVKQ